MGKISDTIIDFLENGGKILGYDQNNLPDLKDLTIILNNNIKVWEYNGMTEREFYGG
tara:strand:+ start:5732 stop:5902 length:171 start_codon:yes stop_codon:yes gene_type:complete